MCTTRPHRLVIAEVITIPHVVVRTIRLGDCHPVSHIIRGSRNTIHADQMVDGVDSVPRGIASFIVVKVFIVPYNILLVVCKEIRIRARRSCRLIQYIKTENRTRGIMVLIFITKSIQCLTRSSSSITIAISYRTKRFVETDQRSIDVRHGSVASRYIQPKHFAVWQV